MSEVCTLLHVDHVAGLLPTTTTTDNSASGTCSRYFDINGCGLNIHVINCHSGIFRVQRCTKNHPRVSAFREAAKVPLVVAELPGLHEIKPLLSEHDKTLDVSPSVACGGITWEEIAPPADAEDGCFKQIPHTLRDIYCEVLTKRSPSVESKARSCSCFDAHVIIFNYI